MSNPDTRNQFFEPTKIDTLCFVGGGAKGYVNTGSYKAFHESGLFSNILTVTGASVGALTASLLSLGMDPDDLHITLSKKTSSELLGKGSSWSFGKLKKDGAGLRELLESSIKEEVSKFFKTNPDQSQLSDSEKVIIEDIKSKITEDNQTTSFTMCDLAILNKLSPDKFKNLAVVAVDKETQALQQFSSVDQTEMIKSWLQALHKAGSIIDKTEFSKEEIETLSQAFEMGLEWKDKKGNDLTDNQSVNKNNLQDRTIIDLCIKNITSLLKKENIRSLAAKAIEGNFQLTKEDLNTIKKIDPVRDYSLITNNDGQTNIYSNVSIVDATLASAALPLVLQNVEINGKKFSDGGQLNNMPHNIIRTDLESLVIAFESHSMHEAVHGGNSGKIFSKSWGRKVIEAILRFLGLCIKKNNEQLKNKEFQDIRDKKSLTTIKNNVAGVETTDFKKAQEQKDEGFLRGYCSTMNHLILYNYHPKAQEIIELGNLHRKKIIAEDPSLAAIQERITNLSQEIEGINQSIDKSSELKEKIKSKLKEKIKLTLDSEKLINSSDIAVDQKLKLISQDLQNFRECFEIRKFIFEAIDKYKGINRKDEWYKKMIEFCMDETKFQGEPVDVFKNALEKFTDHRVLLKKALDNSMISSEIIRKFASAYVANSNSNTKIVQSIKNAQNNTKWSQKVGNPKINNASQVTH